MASNVAEGKTVTMSSLYTSTQHGDGDWEHAVDGDTSQDWYAGGCASTNNEANPWLLLDLGDTFTVTSLKIFNREDGGFCKYCTKGMQLTRCYNFQEKPSSIHLVRNASKLEISKNKEADQLRGNREAGQRLRFRYIDSTIYLLSKS